MRGHRQKVIVVVLFFVLLALPMVQGGLSPFRVKRLKENRTRATQPEFGGLTSLISKDADYAAKFESWFNDNFGLRDFFIRARNQLQFSVFGSSDRIAVGREGYLFFSEEMAGALIDVERHSERDFQRMLSRFKQLAEVLKRRGQKLVLVPIPGKNTFHQEYEPRWAPKRPSPNRFQRHVAALRLNPKLGLLLVDALEILQRHKANQQLFHKTDSHWNPAGASYVAQEFVDTISNDDRGRPIWDIRLEIVTRERFAGGQNTQLGLLYPSTEQAYFVKLEPSQKATGTMKVNQSESNRWSYTADQNDIRRPLPPIVIFGDSFEIGLQSAGYLRFFSKVEKFHIGEFGSLFGQIPPDTRYVVLEYVEGQLPRFFVDEFWPNEVRALD